MPVGEVWRGHVHESWHLLRVESGEMEEAVGSNSIHLRSGGWRLSPAGTAHEVRSTRPTNCRNIHVLDTRLTRRLSRQVARQNHFIEDRDLTSRQSGELAQYETIARACRSILRPYEDGPPEWLVEAREDVLHSHLPIASIARQFQTTREHFAREYDEHFGRSPKQARQIAVLERVLHRLTSTDEGLAAIALDEGFYDQAHMTGAVRRKYGCSPTLLRVPHLASHFSNTV